MAMDLFSEVATMLLAYNQDRLIRTDVYWDYIFMLHQECSDYKHRSLVYIFLNDNDPLTLCDPHGLYVS